MELQDLQTMIDNETALSCQLEALDPDNNNKFVSQQILPYNSRYEVTREQIHIRGLLGEGNFGKVYESEVTLNDGQRRLCALKAPKGMHSYKFSYIHLTVNSGIQSIGCQTTE